MRLRPERLPEPTQALLLLAAVAGDAPLDVLVAAAEASGTDLRSLEAAEIEGIVSLARSRLEFRHPLFRSAIYHGATDARRREAHLVIARAMRADDITGRRAWHLAASAMGVDDEAADALTAAADGALARRAIAAAAAAYERAAELT